MGKKKKSQKYVALDITKVIRTMSSATEYHFAINAPAKYNKLIIQAIASIEQLEDAEKGKRLESEQLR